MPCVCLGRLASWVPNWPPTHTQETGHRHQKGVLVVLCTCQPLHEETCFFHEPPWTFTTQSSCWAKPPLIINAFVQLLTRVQLFATPWTAARQVSLSFTISRSLLKVMSIESVMPSNHLMLCRPLLLPSIFPRSRVFSSESVLRIRWPKDWSFSFNISFSSEYSGLISFRMDWLDLLAVPGTLKSLLQCHSSKVSVLWCSAFFMVQLSHHIWLVEKPQLWLDWPLPETWCLCFLIHCLGLS